jgi:hypothetical protein
MDKLSVEVVEFFSLLYMDLDPPVLYTNRASWGIFLLGTVWGMIMGIAVGVTTERWFQSMRRKDERRANIVAKRPEDTKME